METIHELKNTRGTMLAEKSFWTSYTMKAFEVNSTWPSFKITDQGVELLHLQHRLLL